MDGPERPIGKTQRDRGLVFGHSHRVMVTHPTRLHRGDRMPHQMAHQVDEVAGLADDATSTHCLVLRPVVGRDGARIHRHDERLGLAHGLQQRVHLDDLRREPPVETHHQLRARNAVGTPMGS